MLAEAAAVDDQNVDVVVGVGMLVVGVVAVAVCYCCCHRPTLVFYFKNCNAALQDSLGGNAKTMIVANISPCRMCAQETLSTLQFASRAKHIRNKAVINQDTNGDVAMLQREVMRLRR